MTKNFGGQAQKLRGVYVESYVEEEVGGRMPRPVVGMRLFFFDFWVRLHREMDSNYPPPAPITILPIRQRGQLMQ